VRHLLSGGKAKADVSFATKIADGTHHLVRQRRQGQGTDGRLVTGMRAGQAPQWASSWGCLVSTARHKGVLHGLWRGVTPTMARAACGSGAPLLTPPPYDVLGEGCCRTRPPTSTATCTATTPRR